MCRRRRRRRRSRGVVGCGVINTICPPSDEFLTPRDLSLFHSRLRIHDGPPPSLSPSPPISLACIIYSIVPSPSVHAHKPQYLYDNGAKKFFEWFDHKVWYPLGRPVGTTIYPGMQFIAVFIKRYVVGDYMSLNDVCCYIPAWFGVLASFVVGCIAYEASIPANTGGNVFGMMLDGLRGKYADDKSMMTTSTNGRGIEPRIFGLHSPAAECAIFAMGFMGIVPAHLMRSVGGGYDNESVAVTAMTFTFYLWMRSLRNGDKHGYLYGLFAGVAYFNMVAAWGGYVFVLNLIGAHAAFLVLFGRFSTKVYRAYTLFYIVGTSLAIRVPVVGWSPLKSLEQLGPCAVFLGYQLLYYTEGRRRLFKMTRAEAWRLRVRVFAIALGVVVLLVLLVIPKSYFGPISSRVRGLFVPHTKTGNPLVDSVAEHQVRLFIFVIPESFPVWRLCGKFTFPHVSFVRLSPISRLPPTRRIGSTCTCCAIWLPLDCSPCFSGSGTLPRSFSYMPSPPTSSRTRWYGSSCSLPQLLAF
jgi:hypothetical protein